MRFRPSSELLAFLQADERTTAPDIDAFYIYGSIGIDAYLRRDGVVLIGEYDLMDDAPPRLREAPTLEAISILVAAAEATPQLRELLPNRPDCSPDCELCRGTGWLTVPEQLGLVAAAGRWLRSACRALGLGDWPVVRVTMNLKTVIDAPATTTTSIDIEYRAWRPGKKKMRVCLACHGIGWHALLS